MVKIIDYKAGNAPSVLHAVSHLGFDAEFARAPSDLAGATHIILPGVGSAKATMESLRELDFIEPLGEYVFNKKTPFLGVCVGLQILFEHSAEENTDCLGWFKGQVVKFDTEKVRVPQMGWNLVQFRDSSVGDKYFYFVNSYYAIPENPTEIWGTAEYDRVFAAAVRKDNIFATQFHIEKSGEAGLELLRGFLKC